MAAKTASRTSVPLGDTRGEDKSGPPTFITKLMTMINDRDTNHLISWTENGDTFKVHDAARLAKEVLPKYYKHSNFTSLVRQLNMYGFHKVIGVDQGGLKTQNDQIWEFIHPCVQRGRPDLLQFVKRKQDATTTVQKRLMKHDVDVAMEDLHSLKAQQLQITYKFQDMEKQNQALWQEVQQLRQKHAQQQWKINKIMEFLARLMQPDAASSALTGAAKRRRLAIEPLLNISPNATGAVPPEATVVELDTGATLNKVEMPFNATDDTIQQLYQLVPPDSNSDYHVPQVYQPTPGAQDIVGLDLQGIQDGLDVTRDKLLQNGMDESVLNGILLGPDSIPSDISTFQTQDLQHAPSYPTTVGYAHLADYLPEQEDPHLEQRVLVPLDLDLAAPVPSSPHTSAFTAIPVIPTTVAPVMPSPPASESQAKHRSSTRS